MGAASAVLLVLITILCKSTPGQLRSKVPVEDEDTDLCLVPPLGVYAIAGCGMDLCVNICLTILGYVLACLLLGGRADRSGEQILTGTSPCFLSGVHLLRSPGTNQERHPRSHESAWYLFRQSPGRRLRIRHHRPADRRSTGWLQLMMVRYMALNDMVNMTETKSCWDGTRQPETVARGPLDDE